jgi:hypothetical protein
MVAPRLPLEDGLDLDEESFAWPHPMRSGEALFVVDDAAERAVREATSWGREGV